MQEGATASGEVGFVVYLFKSRVRLQPKGPDSAVGSAQGGEARRRAALLNSKSPQPYGRGGGSQEPTRGGDIRGPAPRELLWWQGEPQPCVPASHHSGEDKPGEQPPACRERGPRKPVMVLRKAS